MTFWFRGYVVLCSSGLWVAVAAAVYTCSVSSFGGVLMGVLLVLQLDGLACDGRRNVRSTSAWRSFLADVSNQALNPMCQDS